MLRAEFSHDSWLKKERTAECDRKTSTEQVLSHEAKLKQVSKIKTQRMSR
ncbi:hypothetical protein [Sedimentibacter sp.]|nr:hypothetical protein [Sedimentibacter sp.]